jgi:hypothetical protein
VNEYLSNWIYALENPVEFGAEQAFCSLRVYDSAAPQARRLVCAIGLLPVANGGQWIRVALEDPDGNPYSESAVRLDAESPINGEMCERFLSCDEIYALADQVLKPLGLNNNNIITWNDDDKLSFPQIAAKLREARGDKPVFTIEEV